MIIISTKGHIVDGKLLGRHLASMTGGGKSQNYSTLFVHELTHSIQGDYDGDTMQAFWNKDLLDSFKSADPKFADPPQSAQDCLVEANVTVSQVLKEDGDLRDKVPLLQEYLLGSLKDPALVGKYSTWWENSLYSQG